MDLYDDWIDISQFQKKLTKDKTNNNGNNSADKVSKEMYKEISEYNELSEEIEKNNDEIADKRFYLELDELEKRAIEENEERKFYLECSDLAYERKYAILDEVEE